MLEKTSEELKVYALLKFTEKLIINTSPTKYLQEKERQKRIESKKKAFQKPKKQPISMSSQRPAQISALKQIQRPQKTVPFQHPPRRPSLKVPQTRLPPQFSYLKPIAEKESEVDIGRLNPILKDPNVKLIETNGPNQTVYVQGTMGRQPTNIKLSKEEIDTIIGNFSKESKIPVSEGATKIASGHLILNAIISEEAGSRFVIQKLPPKQPPMKAKPMSSPPRGIMPPK